MSLTDLRPALNRGYHPHWVVNTDRSEVNIGSKRIGPKKKRKVRRHEGSERGIPECPYVDRAIGVSRQGAAGVTMDHQVTTADADRTYDDPSSVEFGTEIIELTRENELTDVQALGALVYALVNRFMYDLYCGEREDIEFLVGIVRDEATKAAERIDEELDKALDIDSEFEIEGEVTIDTDDVCFSDHDREKELDDLLTCFSSEVDCFRESVSDTMDFLDFSESVIIELRCMGWTSKEIRRFRYFVSEIVDGSYEGMSMVEMDALIRYAICFRDVPLSREFVSDGEYNWFRGEDDDGEDE